MQNGIGNLSKFRKVSRRVETIWEGVRGEKTHEVRGRGEPCYAVEAPIKEWRGGVLVQVFVSFLFILGGRRRGKEATKSKEEGRERQREGREKEGREIRTEEETAETGENESGEEKKGIAGLPPKREEDTSA